MYLITGNHTVAVIKGQESYEILKFCSVLFKSINKIIRDGKINVWMVRIYWWICFLGVIIRYMILIIIQLCT